MNHPKGITPPEKRALPYSGGVDRDMGAYLQDAHGRLVAAFGYHPDGTPATDEVLEVMTACNEYPQAIEELHRALAVIRCPEAFEVEDVCADIQAVLTRARERE